MQFIRIVKPTLISLSAIALVSCASYTPNEDVGTVTGAIAGGLLGSTIGGGTGKAVAIGGSVLGNSIGRSIDEQNTYYYGNPYGYPGYDGYGYPYNYDSYYYEQGYYGY